MKYSKEIAMVILIAGITGIITFAATNYFFGGSKPKTTVEVADPVVSDFDYIGKSYFTTNSINPTKDIIIGNNNNAEPLGGQ